MALADAGRQEPRVSMSTARSCLTDECSRLSSERALLCATSASRRALVPPTSRAAKCDPWARAAPFATPATGSAPKLEDHDPGSRVLLMRSIQSSPSGHRDAGNQQRLGARAVNIPMGQRREGRVRRWVGMSGTVAPTVRRGARLDFLIDLLIALGESRVGVRTASRSPIFRDRNRYLKPYLNQSLKPSLNG